MLVPCLSIRQPYAWLIVRPDLANEPSRAQARAAGQIKDIENRTWATRYRGRLMIHAAKSYSRKEHEADVELLSDLGIELPPYQDLQLGGIVGEVMLRDCVDASDSKWFRGPYGFVLSDAVPHAFRPMAGRLGLFGVTVGADAR